MAKIIAVELQAGAEDRADVGDVGCARALSAKLGGNQNAKQLLRADRRKGLFGETRLAVDRVGELPCDLCRRLSAADEVSRLRRLACSRAANER